MIRKIFSSSAFSQVFHRRNRCLLQLSKYAKFEPRQRRIKNLQSYGFQKSVLKMFPLILPRKYQRPIMLFSGILTFLGLEKKVEEESELIMAIKRGVLCIQRGQFDKAERTLHGALQIAQDEQNEEGVTYIYDLMANLALDTGQNEKAEKLFTEVMQRLVSSGYEVTDNKVIHISLKLAKIYENTNDYEKAEIGYKYCKTNLQDKVAVIEVEDENINSIDTLQLWITTLDTYARFLVYQNRPEEALENFKMAYDMSVQVNGQDHEDTALLLSDLGTTANMLGDLDSAASYAEAAVAIVTNKPEMEHLPIIYMNLGYIYLAKEMFNEAKNACQRGLSFARRDTDESSIQAAKECLKAVDEVFRNTYSN